MAINPRQAVPMHGMTIIDGRPVPNPRHMALALENASALVRCHEIPRPNREEVFDLKPDFAPVAAPSPRMGM